MNIYGVVMAGGGGTRFWPLSRQKRPKQLLNLSGKDFMINETVDRLGRLISFDKIFTVTNIYQAKSMASVLKGRVRENNIIIEPLSRNTAACIGYAAVVLMELYGDGIMCVTPADHFIGDCEMFEKVMIDAVREAEEKESLITIGIQPTFPSTGFGYINFDKCEKDLISKKVRTFVEKPNAAAAEKYIKSGEYLWNSGIFVWKVSVILDEIKKYLPDLYEKLMQLKKFVSADLINLDSVGEIYKSMENISIDYGVMEKSEIVRVIPAAFDWHDVGSWENIDIFHKKDENGNILVGDVLSIDSCSNTIYSDSRFVAAVGIENTVIVETPDAVLVCARSHVQDVRKIVDMVKASGRKELL